ncbi:DEAD/DEAH box helicase family protein [Shewanella sp. NIFS-20-20]|uniref:DEAD/DEAH box helicase family protein n=1 Tax=Shewanella sp. NIFS-20-20 TaxID=2853806 RepID=UPI001C4445BB|nr:DEAD/DEAH box helicase family protein [Shewanella sp. NIFS-20-20]MBV7314445.1 DEAD/DEAH box helicase family protein [Shewanella sp. NIFS-20-20]
MDFNQLNFKYPWRPYQQRVLDAVDEHLDDSKLHVVAAPGAGKTTLGIEVFKRLKSKALILSPTRVIRDQWIDRLRDFTQCNDPFQLAWTSQHLDTPKAFTSITYQALHAKMKHIDDLADDREDETETSCPNALELAAFITHLQAAAIKVLILDEAHHLRQEWWKALTSVCEAIPDMVLVSLTATPPYDAQGHEWSKYEQLCGPIDEEISVPELVKASTLCAHQDYVWAVDVTADEKVKIHEFDGRVKQMCANVLANDIFLDICRQHQWLNNPQQYAREIVSHPHLLISILSLLKHKNMAMPSASLSFLDLTHAEIPSLSRYWLQKLIEGVLFSNSYALSKSQDLFVEQLKKQLRASELLYKRELMLEHSRRFERSLSLSVAKIKGCLDIHRLELKKRRQGLRQVILTDYIRDEARSSASNIGEINLGSWPVFEKLVQESQVNHDIAMLTGRLSIIHESKRGLIEQQDLASTLSFLPIAQLPGYLEIRGPLNQLTVVITTLLCQGQLKTLVGTRSLLGEGWDAPVVNSLILASAVGSFMLTNQMRGRAIRIDKHHPQKASSIWHLVAIDRESHFGLSDFFNLKKRFLTFVGLAQQGNAIESGFERLDTKLAFYLKSNQSMKYAVYANNKQMLARFKAIDSLASQWQAALIVDKSARTLPSVEVTKLKSFKIFHLKNTFKYLTQELLLGTFSVLLASASLLTTPQSLKIGLWCLAGGLGYVFVKNLAKTIKAVRVTLLHLPVDGSLKQIGRAVLESLAHTDKLTTPLRLLDVKTSEALDGSLSMALTGGTFFESSLFADNVAEVLGPIDNPRYIVVREGDFMGLGRKDYHAVPTIMAVKKEAAEIFITQWSKYVGSADLIYTRSEQGRASLLKAKMRAFSSTFANDMRRIDRWQ